LLAAKTSSALDTMSDPVSIPSASSDLFICHASEDKPDFVRPLAQHLVKSGAIIFYDEFSIKLGDSLSTKINEGLTVSRNAVLVLSKYFFEKPWTNAELQAVFQRRLSGEMRLLIVYHGVSHDEVRQRYPLLADIKAVNSSDGIHEVARQIFDAIEFVPRIGFGTSELGATLQSINNSGFHCTIRLSVGAVADPIIDKYICDFGTGDSNGRVSIILRNNTSVVACICDNKGRSMSVSMPADESFKRPQVLTLVVSAQRNAIILYADAARVSVLQPLPAEFLDGIIIEGSMFLLNSRDLLNPCPATVSFLTYGKELSDEEVNQSFAAIRTFNETLGR
jgi:hypothetical protein